jgi:hypothetical protein
VRTHRDRREYERDQHGVRFSIRVRQHCRTWGVRWQVWAVADRNETTVPFDATHEALSSATAVRVKTALGAVPSNATYDELDAALADALCPAARWRLLQVTQCLIGHAENVRGTIDELGCDAIIRQALDRYALSPGAAEKRCLLQVLLTCLDHCIWQAQPAQPCAIHGRIQVYSGACFRDGAARHRGRKGQPFIPLAARQRRHLSRAIHPKRSRAIQSVLPALLYVSSTERRTSHAMLPFAVPGAQR